MKITLTYLNFQPIEIVSRYRDPHPQVVENHSYLFNLRPNSYKSVTNVCSAGHFEKWPPLRSRVKFGMAL